MADILAAFDELEKKENSKKPLKSTNKKFVNPLKSSSGSQRTGRPQQRPTSSNNLVPPTSSHSDHNPSSRSPSVVSNRRISFVAPPVPPSTQRRLRIPTKTASLASGFVWDPKLSKYGVSEREWAKFSDDIVGAAHLPKRAKFAWPLVRNDVIAKIKKDLDFVGNVRTELKQWSAHFRQKGFVVGLELPGKVKEREDDTIEERVLAEGYEKLFRVVISPNSERSASIYSRNSSLTRSITGEGRAAQRSRSNSAAGDEDEDGDADEEEDAMGPVMGDGERKGRSTEV